MIKSPEEYGYPKGHTRESLGYYPLSNTEAEVFHKLSRTHIRPNLDFAQFGVYMGVTLKHFLDGADYIQKPWRKIYALDAFFGGFPKETKGVYINPTWPEGKLCLKREKGFRNINQVVSYLNNYLSYPFNYYSQSRSYIPNKRNIEYVIGYYENTLNKQLAENIGIGQLSFVDIDCDLHSSTVEVLDFLFTYKLMCIGCLIRFDDFMGTPWTGGEKLALLEATEKYNFKLSSLSDNVFKLERY